MTPLDRLRPLPARAARFLRERPLPRHAGVRTRLLDVLLQRATDRGTAFVVAQLLCPQLPGSGDEIHADSVHDVLAVLDRFEVTAFECEWAFGPNWGPVVEHAFSVADLVQDHRAPSLATVTDSHRRLGAWLRARDVASECGRADAWYRAQAAAWEPRYRGDSTMRTDDAGYAEIVVAVRDVAAALCVADLVDRGDFTRLHVETLVAPWHRMTNDLATAGAE